MNRRLIPVVLLMVSTACPAYTGEEILKMLNGSEKDALAALLYIDGAAAGLLEAGKGGCPPEGASVGQVIGMIGQQLDSDPSFLKYEAASTIRYVMATMWPCRYFTPPSTKSV